MRKELQPLPLGKLPPPQAGLRRSSGDKITVPLERGGDDLSASLRMFSPSAFNRTPLSAGTPTSFPSRFIGLSPGYSKHSDLPLPQLTPDSRKRMSNLPTPTERALPLKRQRQSSHLEPVMTVDSLDDPLKNDSNLYSPLLNDLSALKSRRLLEPLLTPLRPPESRNHQRIRDGEWEMGQLPWQRGSDSQTGGDEQRDLPSPPGIHSVSRPKRTGAESGLAGLPQRLSGTPSKVTSETINDYGAEGEEKHGNRVVRRSGDGGSGSAMKDLPDEGNLSVDAGNHHEVHSTGTLTREASGNFQKTEAMSIREQGLGERVDLPRSGASGDIGYSALPAGPNSFAPSEVRPWKPRLDSSNGVGLRMPPCPSPTIASAVAPSMATARTPTPVVSAPTTVTPPVISPTMITPPAPSAINQPAPAGMNQAAPALMNQAAPALMNQAAPALITHAAPPVSNVAPQNLHVPTIVPEATLMGIANGMAIPPVSMLPWASYQAPEGKAAIPGLKRTSPSPESAGYDRSRTMASNDAKPKVVRNREAALKSRTAAKAKMEKLEQCNAELKDAVNDLIRRNDVLRKALES